MGETIRQRIDSVLEHIQSLKAKPVEIVLTKADLEEFCSGEPATSASQSYRNVHLRQGGIDGSSYVTAEGTPSGASNFGV